METFKIIGEAVFQIVAAAFAISPSASGYTLNYSVDGVNWTAYEEATEADKTELVNSPVAGMYYKLAGNTSEVTIRY